MTADLSATRRRFAEELGAASHLPRSLIDAIATVPRERYLGPGPWLTRGRQNPMRAQPTPDDDPTHVYQDNSIAIDASRELYNGAPSFLAMAIAALDLKPGEQVLHVGAGLGYYTAIMGEIVGPSGAVIGIEVDPRLAERARGLVPPQSPVDIRYGDGRETLTPSSLDAILVNAGVTHPQPAWLDALRPSGRLVLPLTVSLPGMGTIGKGVLVHVRQRPDADFDARFLSHIAIYSAIGLTDEGAAAALGQALARSPQPLFTRLSRRPHERTDRCWLHTPDWCLSD